MKNLFKKYNQLIIGVVIGSTLFSSISVMAENKTIEAFYNSIKIKVNGNEVKTDEEPFIKNGRTFVPARFVAENLGAEVVWNENDNTVEINSKIDGKKYVKTNLDGIKAVLLEGDEIFISVDDLQLNQDKPISELLKNIPISTPSPSVSPTVSPTPTPNGKEGSDVSTDKPTVITYNGCEALKLNDEIYILITYSDKVYNYKADFNPETETITLTYKEKEMKFKRTDKNYVTLYNQRVYIKLSILENFINN